MWSCDAKGPPAARRSLSADFPVASPGGTRMRTETGVLCRAANEARD